MKWAFEDCLRIFGKFEFIVISGIIENIYGSKSSVLASSWGEFREREISKEHRKYPKTNVAIDLGWVCLFCAQDMAGVAQMAKLMDRFKF